MIYRILRIGVNKLPLYFSVLLIDDTFWIYKGRITFAFDKVLIFGRCVRPYTSRF